jgi:hypothetical protein
MSDEIFNWRSEERITSIYRVEEPKKMVTRFLRNVSEVLLYYTAPHPRVIVSTAVTTTKTST